MAQFRSAVAVPANNELRYAGHHLLQALDSKAQLFRQLRDAVHMLHGSRDDLNAMIDEDRVKEQTESRRFLLQFVARVAGGLVAAIGLIWTIWYTLLLGNGVPVS